MNSFCTNFDEVTVWPDSQFLHLIHYELFVTEVLTGYSIILGVGIATGYGLDDKGVGVQVPVW
jgi:hypothetical protein